MPRSYLDKSQNIFSLATAYAESALAIIRCSGPESVNLLAKCFSKPEVLKKAKGKSLVHGDFLNCQTGEAIDNIIVGVYLAPDSANGDTTLEINCHGSLAIIKKILLSLELAGFVPALAGEFTFRAFINGKLDLSQAEAINELVLAKSDKASKAALSRLEGSLSKKFRILRASLLEMLSTVEAVLDHEALIEEQELKTNYKDKIVNILSQSKALISTYYSSVIFNRGARLVIAGRPNAGKSSLFNFLLREERAIVSAQAGTTRDWIEFIIEIEGYPVRLIDTAGLRDSKEEIEKEGIARSQEQIKNADIVILIVDGSERLFTEDKELLNIDKPLVKIWNKIDSPDCKKNPDSFIALSVKTGQNIEQFYGVLKLELEKLFLLNKDNDNLLGESIASERQKIILEELVRILENCLELLEIENSNTDILALELRRASDCLAELTGEITNIEIIDAIFSKFCLGK